MSGTHQLIPVVLCGGSGSRLWPLSRAGFPKQFLVLSGQFSLFQQALQRVNALGAPDLHIQNTLVVTHEAHRFLVLDQLRELATLQATLLLEPQSRNTAPALTLAALQALQTGADPILVVSPADQQVGHVKPFVNTVQQAARLAAQDQIVILGVPPERPETGFGYIRFAAALGPLGEHQVLGFTEKPDEATARHYLAQGHYAWNSGLFVLKASVWLRALEHFRPDILQTTRQAWEKQTQDAGFVRPDASLFAQVPGESVDYAVMERCPGTFPMSMLPLEVEWTDLGTWDAVWQQGASDEAGNVVHGDVLLEQAQRTLVHATHRLVGVVGTEDLVIVETPDAVLVAHQDQTQQVKALVAQLESRGRQEHLLHRKVYRPWGWYDSIDEGSRFKVKRIQVKPKSSLSLQMHHHRAEHWVVVKGTAEVTCGDRVVLLTENQSTYIPLGEVHRLRNPGTIPLEIIEVQSGSYLGEDDIVRFEDHYGRGQDSV